MCKKTIKTILFYFILIRECSGVSLQSKDLKVVDGDTIKYNKTSMRMAYIDTFEKEQECSCDGEIIKCGIYVKNILSDFIKDKEIDCETIGKDKYGRLISECYANGYSISRYLLENGYAYLYKKNKYSKYFKDAFNNKKGLFSCEYFEHPYIYRKRNKSKTGRSPKCQPCPSIYNIAKFMLKVKINDKT